jgi:hypothetical protein
VRGGRNEYFRFGLPAVSVEGLPEQATVCCNGVEMCAGEGVFRFPTSLPSGEALQLEVRRGQTILKRHTLTLLDEIEWRQAEPAQLFDRFGGVCGPSLAAPNGVAGACLVGTHSPAVLFSPPPSCFVGRRVFFVGQSPGQIVSWPKEDLPTDWTPVWAVPMGRRGRALYCGDPARAREDERVGGAARSPRKKVREWKQLLYHWRRKITPPENPEHRRLWRQYQEVARDVRA